MSKLTFYNYNKQTFDPKYNLVRKSLDLTKVPKDIDIIFPYVFKGVFKSDQLQLRQHLVDSYGLANNPYRIMFSSRHIANNKLAQEFSDLACASVDLALGQELNQRLPYSNYFRLPMWCLEFFGLFPTIQNIQTKIEQLEALRKQNPFLRNKFLGLVSKRDCKYYVRGVKSLVLDIILSDNYLSTFCTESAGRFRNNTDDLSIRYQNNKIKYLEQFIFNLCPESMHYFSVVTEKLAQCLEAGCIPIYWGDLAQDSKYFNRAALIEVDPSKRMELPLKIKEALFYANDFVAQNIFNDYAAQMIFEDIYLPIFRKIEQDLQVPIYSLVRAN